MREKICSECLNCEDGKFCDYREQLLEDINIEECIDFDTRYQDNYAKSGYMVLDDNDFDEDGMMYE